jgi:hypothetical protein
MRIDNTFTIRPKKPTEASIDSYFDFSFSGKRNDFRYWTE